jgi:hypothetical protein
MTIRAVEAVVVAAGGEESPRYFESSSYRDWRQPLLV